MQHGQLVGILVRHRVHDVEGKVELVLVLEGDGLERAVFVLHAVDELLGNQRRFLVGGHQRLAHLVLGDLLARQNHGQEGAVLAVHGDHAVGCGGVVDDAVALVEHLGAVAHAHHQRAADDQVELLAGVGGGVDGLILLLGGIFVLHPVGLGQLVAEHGRKILDGDAVLLGGGQALAPARDGVVGQVGAVTLQQLGHLNAEGLGALVNNGEGKIHASAFILHVGLLVQTGILCHFSDRQAQNLAHVADAQRDLLKLGERIVHVPVLPSVGVNKNRPKALCFETGENTLAVPLKLQPIGCPSSDSIKPYAFTQQSRKPLLAIDVSGLQLGSDRFAELLLPVRSIHRLSESIGSNRLRHRLCHDFQLLKQILTQRIRFVNRQKRQKIEAGFL